MSPGLGVGPKTHGLNQRETWKQQSSSSVAFGRHSPKPRSVTPVARREDYSRQARENNELSPWVNAPV